MSILPIVIESTPRGERSFDLFSRLLADRLIFLEGHITDETANSIVAQLLYLESKSQSNDIIMYLNSPGGSVTAGLAIYDTMQYIKPDICTIAIGMADSMGSVLLSSGTKGKRYSLPHTEIMIHQPLGSYGGQVSDIEIHAKRMSQMKGNLIEILASNCGKSAQELEQDMDRDNFMTASQAVEYGLIDSILRKRV